MGPLVLFSHLGLFLISFSLLIAENDLFVPEDDIFIKSSIINPLLLLVGFLVDEAMTLYTDVVIAKHLVFDFLRLEAEESFKCEHGIILLERYELAHDC